MDYNKNLLPSTVLHWNYRGLTEFPMHQLRGEESEVTDIYLKENLISRLPSDIGMLEYLESLYLSGNDITELPREISKLRCLKCLDVSGNRLRRVPNEIGEARCLKFLILDENELTELPLRISELRCLRYLSICDNKLKWLPQRPVYNYHHCEFRFWRNASLKTLPYSLWYHMFRDQQTRSLNIGCLSDSNREINSSTTRGCRLKLAQESKEWDLLVNTPPQYSVIRTSADNSPPSLQELCKRILYQMISDTAKSLSTQHHSIYSDNVVYTNYENNNITDLQDNFEEFNLNNKNDNCDVNGNVAKEQCTAHNVAKKFKSHYVTADIIEEYFSFLPYLIKSDITNGPVSRCENLSCKQPIFDYVFYEFCFGKIILIDKSEEVILSVAFCSKLCADSWKTGKGYTIPWTLASGE